MNIPITKKLTLCLILAAVIFTCPALSSCAKSVAANSGNVSNYGYILADGDDIYYTKIVEDEEGDFYSNIYKYNTKSGTEILVAENESESMYDLNAYLALDGGYLYFLPNFLHKSVKEVSDNIYRVKPDGKNTRPEPLFKEDISVSFMHVSNGTIFYYDDAEYAIYKMKTDGTKRQLICEASVSGIAVGRDKIYYSEYELLMAVSVNGGEPEEIFDFEDFDIYIEYLVLEGDYLFYLDDNQSTLGRIKTDGTEPRTLFTYDYIEHFNISGGTLYFVVDEYGSTGNYAVLSLVPGSRSPRVVVSDKEDLGEISPIAIWGGTVYFIGFPNSDTIMDSDEVWFTAGIGGGEMKAFRPLNVYYYEPDDDD